MRLWEGEAPGLGLERQKNGAEAEKGSVGSRLLTDHHETKAQRRDSTDVLRKLSGEGGPLSCRCSLPIRTHHLSPHIFPEHWVPCQALGVRKGGQTARGPACATGRHHVLTGAAKGPPRNTGLRVLEFRGEIIQELVV